jgi:hypothetical protein
VVSEISNASGSSSVPTVPMSTVLSADPPAAASSDGDSSAGSLGSVTSSAASLASPAADSTVSPAVPLHPLSTAIDATATASVRLFMDTLFISSPFSKG